MQPSADQSHTPKPDRLLLALQHLLALPITDVRETIHQMAQLVAQALSAEKVDVFLADLDQQQFRAYGVSQTPMGFKEIAMGLDCLSFEHAGRMGEVYRTGSSYWTGQAQHDPVVLKAMKEDLQIQSHLAVPLGSPEQRLGVVVASSSHPDYFSQQDISFLESVGRWAGIVVQHAKVVEMHTAAATEQAKQVAAEELLTVVAHDLRNFLTPLKGQTDLLERRARKEGQEQYIRRLESISQGMGRFQRLLTDLLDVERLAQGAFTLQLRQMDLVATIREILPIWSSDVHPMTLQAPETLVIHADRDRLLQAVANLLSNATQYASPQSEIEIKVSQHERADGPWACITISNWGDPLPVEQRRALFQPFVKGPHSCGFGLGLSITQRIAQAHHGILTAHMEAKGLTHFTLTLPCYATPSSPG